MFILLMNDLITTSVVLQNQIQQDNKKKDDMIIPDTAMDKVRGTEHKGN
jgi:hypothetical protein